MAGQLDKHFELTPAEKEVLRLLAEGLSDEEMAAELGIELSSARSRLRGIYEKTGFSGRRVVAWAKDHLACCGNGSRAA